MPDVVALTISLCKIPSLTGDEAQICEAVATLLADVGFSIKKQQLGQGRQNLLALLSPNPRLLLTTHLDTVPPYFAPQLSADGEWLVGRGTCDAKGIAAAMICAAEILKREGIHDIGLLFVVGEETHSDGAKSAAQDFAPQVDYFINGEPTDLKLASGMKGTLVFDLECHGQAGHSAYPESGRSAVHQLATDIHAILAVNWPNDSTFGQTTVNIGTLEGGRAPNVIADYALAKGMMRTTQDADVLQEKLSSTVSGKLNILSKSSPSSLHTIPGYDTCTVAFGSDIPHLSNLGKPLLIGPGSILDAHTAHEKVRVSDLEKAVHIYVDLCKRLLK